MGHARPPRPRPRGDVIYYIATILIKPCEDIYLLFAIVYIQLQPTPTDTIRATHLRHRTVDLAHRRSADLTLRLVPQLSSTSSSSSSPTKTTGSALLSAAACHGSRHLDRAIRYLLMRNPIGMLIRFGYWVLNILGISPVGEYRRLSSHR
jgi:hypothetical protein